MALPGVSTRPLRTGYDVIIIGAGVQGLAIAYELCKRGHTDVLVVDRDWPGSGASGRNGELIRSTFASPEWCDLYELSRQRWVGLSAELDYNLLFNRTGYAVLASTEETWSSCVADAEFQKSRGVPSELLDAQEMRKLLPTVNPDLIRGGVFQQEAGFAHHDSVVAAYLKRAADLGAHICADHRVIDIETRNDRVEGIKLADGQRVAARVVVNAAGGASEEINSLVGVDAGITANRLEILVTQPVKPFLAPALAAIDFLGYCHQTDRGEFVGGTERPKSDRTTTLNGSWEMLKDMATKFTTLFPMLSGVRVLRHWAGTVSQTPDLGPVLGPVPQLDGYLLSVGWVYGYMGAPAAGQLLADYIVTESPDERMTPFSIERIATGQWIQEGSLVVEQEF